MDYKKLGNTDIEVSTFALGCWPFAGGDVWGEQDDGDSIAAVHAALDAGINFFDTAEGYGAGKSEQVLGEGLVGRRQEAIIATKISPPHLDPKLVEETCDNSLKHLGTDYIDLYQIHWPNHDIPLDYQWEALTRLVEKGKVRTLGVCNFAIDDLSEALNTGECQSDQLPYNLAWRAIEYEIQSLCSESNTGIICYSPLAQGVLTGRYKNADEVPDGLARSRHYSKDRPQSSHDEDGCEEELFEAVEKIRYVADQMQHWFEEQACDGFMVQAPYQPAGFEEFVRYVVPELQQRKLLRTEYHGETLRENLGLERPAVHAWKERVELVQLC